MVESRRECEYGLESFVMIGCKALPEIESYSDAEKLCPILKAEKL